MAANEPVKKVNKEMIEENLKRAFSDKAEEDVPADLLALLDQLRSQDKENDLG